MQMLLIERISVLCILFPLYDKLGKKNTEELITPRRAQAFACVTKDYMALLFLFGAFSYQLPCSSTLETKHREQIQSTIK